MTRIAIIGAGPAGSYLAYHLAKSGQDVHVYEEHDTIGKPIQCTGILTRAINEMIPEGNYVKNTIRDVRIVSPDGEHIDVQFSEDNLIVCRTKFDRFIGKMAEKEGAEYHLGHRYLSHEGREMTFKVSDAKERITADIVVGADGPGSLVAKSAGIFGNREFFMGVQATVEMDNDNLVETYLAHGDFAWIVPESKKRVRVGLCTRAHAHKTFDKFMSDRYGKDYQNLIVARQGGLIPMYDPKVRTQAGNTYILGDAATMVKATTAGGIIQGMTAARELADVLINGGDYEKRWRAHLHRDLWLHLVMRRLMDRFTATDYNRLVHIFQREANSRVLGEFDRDYPTQYLLRLALQEPRLALFGKVLFQKSKVDKSFMAG